MHGKRPHRDSAFAGQYTGDLKELLQSKVSFAAALFVCKEVFSRFYWTK